MIKKWFAHRVRKSLWIHYNKNSRIRFNLIYAGCILSTLAIYLVSILLFYFYGLRFDSDKTIPYSYVGHNIAFLIPGIILFIVDTLFAVLVDGIYFPILFSSSQKKWFQSDEYKGKVKQFKTKNLTHYKINDLKWFYKLKWIEESTYVSLKRDISKGGTNLK